MLETHDDVIGIAHNDDLTLGMALPRAVWPETKDVMEVDIGQQRRGNRPLGRACLRGHKLSFFHHTCLQPLADKAAYTTITDAVFNETHQPLVVDRVEESCNIGVHYPVHLRASNPDGQCVQRIMLTAPWSEPVREPEEVFFVDCVEHLHHCTLNDLIFQWRSPAGVAAHRVLVCSAVVKGALDRCPDGCANAIRLGWLPGSACNSAMSDHPLRVPLPA